MNNQIIELHSALHKESQNHEIQLCLDGFEGPKAEQPVCKIINDHFSYIMDVDGHLIPFNLCASAEYFADHFEGLGYKVVYDKRQKKNVVYYRLEDTPTHVPLRYEFKNLNYPTDEEVVEYFESKGIKPINWWREHV